MAVHGRLSLTIAVALLVACTARPYDEEDGDGDGSMGSSATTTMGPSETMTSTTTVGTTPPADSGATDPMTTVSTVTDTDTPTVTVTDTVTATDTDEPPTMSHDLIIQPIWNEHCVDGCHTPGGEWDFHLLSPGDAYASIVGVPSTQAVFLNFIEPGDPEASYLWHKINDTQADVGGGALPMPKPRRGMDPTVLTPEQFDLIEQWILDGAPP